MTDTTTVIERLNTGGRPMTWAERAKGVQQWLQFLEEDIKAILADDLATEGIKQSCRRLAVALGMIGATVDMLASVCDEKRPGQQVPDVAGVREEQQSNKRVALSYHLGLILDLANLIQMHQKSGTLNQGDCLDWTSKIKAHTKTIRNRFDIED